jgi:hypothetical protein
LNLLISRLLKPTMRTVTGVLGIAVLASLIHAQAPRHLQVEVGPNQQVLIVASEVSYGEVLRTMQQKLGWEIEVPAVADELKISYIRLETKQPRDALAKLLEGSRLGYAFQGEANGAHIQKVVVIVSAGEAGTTKDTVTIKTNVDSTNSGSSVSAAPQVAGTAERPQAPSMMPLAEAINAIGAPAGVPPAEVGRRMTFSISDAANVMGVPPGVSPDEVGKMTVLPMSAAAKIIGVAPGASASDVGKTMTLPLPSGPGKRP